MMIAKEKCWIAKSGGEIVADGDEKAAKLLAVKGGLVKEARLENLSNADEFFEPLNPKTGDRLPEPRSRKAGNGRGRPKKAAAKTSAPSTEGGAGAGTGGT